MIPYQDRIGGFAIRPDGIKRQMVWLFPAISSALKSDSPINYSWSRLQEITRCLGAALPKGHYATRLDIEFDRN